MVVASMAPTNGRVEVESDGSDYQSLEALLQQLHNIVDSIPFLDSQAYKPPIIEGDGHAQNTDPILGLRIFKDAVKREVEVLQQFLARPDHGPELSTNAYYFISVWNEIMSATPPIVAIGKIFDPPNNKKKTAAAGGIRAGGVKVDIVADEGRQWIRVNTMKNSRILAEFREFDSYLTGSDDSDEDSDLEESFNPPTDQDNSLLRMGRALVAASAVPVPGTNERPSVTLRLTRLNPGSSGGDTDPRIAQTMSSLKSMGISVELGERSFRSLHNNPVALRSRSGSSVQFHPTSRINLDLSMLIALVSDLSHASLPQDEDEAWARFRMPANARSWKLGKSKAGDTLAPAVADEDEDLSKHSRALSTQCIQEMDHGIVGEVAGRLKAASLQNETFVPEFWTTEEARDRCLQIVHKIGGSDEKRRASALFPTSLESAVISRCQQEFWRGSRYPAFYIPSFFPIRIHPSDLILSSARPTSPFWGHLVQTCRHILSHDARPHPKLYRKDGEMERAKVTKLNTKLTVHTVESMLVGACAGMTTLTANKASVRAMLREMKVVKPEREDGAVIETLSGVWLNRDDIGTAAAIWIVEPRSLAEGMRADRVQ